MCTYNGAQYVQGQLLSILNQTYQPCELIICDDHSQDNTVALVSELISATDIPVKIHVHEKNIGINDNFASAISMCTGEYIALSDQDDIWDGRKLQIFADEIADSRELRPLLLYSDFRLINGISEPLETGVLDAQQVRGKAGVTWSRLAFGNIMPGCTMVFQRDALKHVLPIPQEALLHDWWIALILSLQGSLKYVDQELMSYRIHSGNSQGLNSFKRTFRLMSKLGAIRIATNNMLLALRQLQTARGRLAQFDLAQPEPLAKICNVVSAPRLVRPYILFKSGVRRIRVLLICIFIGSRQSCDDSIGHV